MTISEVTHPDILFFEAVCGSHAYGTNIAGSDVDLRGVFVLPRSQFFGLEYTPQVSDVKNDEVYYELGRFFELLSSSNPNMLELLAMPADCIRYQHPLFQKIKPEYFLSKACKQTFAGYAFTQIRKAKGLNKKINNPMSKERKTVLDFCYVLKEHGSIPLKDWLQNEELEQEKCGLVSVPNFPNTYAIFYDQKGDLGLKGIMNKPTANDILLSSVPKGVKKIGLLSFNKNGYQVYCKEYKQYWDWVNLRNEQRYENTIEHGKNYDAKNMMHTFRLLDMAAEIAQHQEIRVRRPNREVLLEIRKGKFEYDDLVKEAEKRLAQIEYYFDQSKLPEQPDYLKINQLLVEIRENWYQ